MTIVGFKRLFCSLCSKVRHHETMSGLAKCVTCDTQRKDGEHETNIYDFPLVNMIERFGNR